MNWAVVERDVFDPAYRKVLETLSTEDAALGRVKYYTQSFSGGGKFYVVERRA